MSKFLWCALAISIVLLSSAPYHAPEPRALPVALHGRTIDALTIYELGEAVTGTPAAILSGIHFAESTRGTNMRHTNPNDRGEFGLHESPSYHAERVAKWGEYDATNPAHAAIMAGHIVANHAARLGSERLAIAAYHQGAHGVERDGPCRWYVERVEKAGGGKI